ncbi:MAG: hypothetical protein LBR21_07525 [Propionibacteriaceae bacterium]|jgi:hypothetical protein|nr:hypothetical protein [Propionibacteriaceae bacterium]
MQVRTNGRLVTQVVVLALVAIADVLAWSMVLKGTVTRTEQNTAFERIVAVSFLLAVFPILTGLIPKRPLNTAITLVCGAALLAGAMLGGLSVGLLYMPAAVLLLLSAVIPNWKTLAVQGDDRLATPERSGHTDV